MLQSTWINYYIQLTANCHYCPSYRINNASGHTLASYRECRVQFQDTSCGIYGEKVALGQAFHHVLSSSLSIHNHTMFHNHFTVLEVQKTHFYNSVLTCAALWTAFLPSTILPVGLSELLLHGFLICSHGKNFTGCGWFWSKEDYISWLLFYSVLVPWSCNWCVYVLWNVYHKVKHCSQPRFMITFSGIPTKSLDNL